jgi:hypothetical protein
MSFFLPVKHNNSIQNVSEFESRWGKDFSPLHVTQADSVSYPIGTGGSLFPWRIMRQGREAYHLPPTSVQIKNVWIYVSTPPYVFMA